MIADPINPERGTIVHHRRIGSDLGAICTRAGFLGKADPCLYIDGAFLGDIGSKNVELFAPSGGPFSLM